MAADGGSLRVRRVLADDMGLGKTLQVIAVILASKLESPDDQGTALIVTPASLVYNWRRNLQNSRLSSMSAS